MSLYTARTIGGGTDAIGTTLPTFRHGLNGPTFYTGSADPTVTPPTPMDDGFHDGDVYIRGTAGGSALWIYDTVVWTQIASGAGGGSFAGDIIMVSGAQLLGDPAADASAPAFAFDGDIDTGMYQDGANELAFATGGTQALVIESDGTLASTIAGYETLVLADNDIPNRKYVEDNFINASGDTMTGDLSFDPATQVLIASGSASDPSVAFALDPDNGFYLDATNSIGISSTGVRVASFNTVGLQMRSGTQVIGDTGAVGAPSIAFNGDLNTGIFHDSTAGEIAISSAGTETIRLGATTANGTLIWQGGAGSAAIPALSFQSDTNTGFYSISADVIGISVAGVNRWAVQANGDIEPAVNNTYDIGASALRVATVYATTFDGTATAALYGDLAERYTVGDCCDPRPGDVVVICDHEDHDICSALDEADDRVLGVVSTNPAYMMNKDAGDDQTAPYIALRGRVPVNVCGPVRKGDLLITSDDEGSARALTAIEKHTVSPHAVFAKALSSHDGEDFGQVEAVIL